MVLISGSILIAVLIIAAIGGGTFITGYWRDVVTKEYESEIAVSKDETVEKIMDDDSIDDDQKTQLLMKYLGTTAPSGFDFGEFGKYIPILVGGYVAAAILGGRK
jgi:hypothetical protein